MITINGVSKVYGKTNSENQVIALNDINLEIKDGEFLGIVGESGSGKSTLLNLIGSLDKPTSGTIQVNGCEITCFSEKQTNEYRKKEIGFIFQNFFLEPQFTVMQNIIIPLMINGIPKKDRESLVDNVLKELKIFDKKDKKISELSGGQMQKVSIARALIKKPSIILADEPTGNLDSENGSVVVDILKNLSLKGISVILVTHNQKESEKCDRLIQLKDGKIV